MKRLLSLIPALIILLSACGPKEDPYISIDGKTTLSLDFTAQQVVVAISTNVNDWSYNLGEAASWVTATQSASSLTLSVQENSTGAVRRAVIAFSASTASCNLVVNQNSLEPTLSLSCGRQLDVPYTAGTTDVTVDCNLPSWGFETATAWISLAASGNKLKVSCEANPDDAIREGSVKVFAPATGTPQILREFTVRQAEAEIEYETEMLSEGGSSNCYLISHKGRYRFDATVRGNGRTVTGLREPDPLSPAGAKLVWQSAKGMIKSVSFASAKGEIEFEATRINGNALIAALDGSGKIIWSWHIWFPEDEPAELDVESGETIMGYNLGAMHSRNDHIGSYGLLYQWGRKDPFPGSPLMHDGSITTVGVPVYDINGASVSIGATSRYDLKDNNLAFSIANPTVCISNNQQYAKCRDWLQPAESNTALWGNPNGSVRTNGEYRNLGSKTYYDPCPKGWRVPSPKTLKHLTKSGGMVWAAGESHGDLTWADLGGATEVRIVDIDGDGRINLNDYTDGWTMWMDRSKGSKSYFPATTRYDGSYAMLMGSMVGLWGNWWYNSPSLDSDGNDTYLGNCMSFGIKEYGSNGPQDEYSVTLSPVANGSRADAYAIRCIRE